MPLAMLEAAITLLIEGASLTVGIESKQLEKNSAVAARLFLLHTLCPRSRSLQNILEEEYCFYLI